MNNDLMKTQYELCISEYSKLAAAVREICPTPKDCDYLISDNDIMNFMNALKAFGQLLASIKEYSLFSWDDLNKFMNEDEFLEYKAWYFTFYDELKEKGGMDATLNALDINSKIVRSNEVDKAYVIDMLKRVSLHSGEDREKDIKLIKREIDRTDNEQMRHKAPIMKEFINTRFPNFDPNTDIEEEYRGYEKEVFETSIVEFSKKHNLKPEFVRSVVNEYFADRQSITKITLHERLADKNLTLIKQTATINGILTFIRDMYNKFKN